MLHGNPPPRRSYSQQAVIRKALAARSAPPRPPDSFAPARVEIVCCNVRAAVAVDSSKDLHKSCRGWNLLRYGPSSFEKRSGLRLAQLSPDIREVVRPGAFRVGFERLPSSIPPEPFKCSRIPGHQHP